MARNSTDTQKISDIHGSEQVEEKHPVDIPDASLLYEQLHEHSHALEAFGALLETSSLHLFSDEDMGTRIHPEVDTNKTNLRWGLSQIIDLYVEKQEMIADEYLNQFLNSDYVLLTHAEKGIELCRQGMWNTVEATIKSLKDDIYALDMVIDRSEEFRDRAKWAKKSAENMINQLKEREKKPI